MVVVVVMQPTDKGPLSVHLRTEDNMVLLWIIVNCDTQRQWAFADARLSAGFHLLYYYYVVLVQQRPPHP